ncbi:MAG: HU family DNA-binding protein [Prevotella sp.]|nr:HU family DNA-binding protein [Prevotella sp.]
MSRISIPDIASSLVKKHGLSPGDAEKFVTALFNVINDGLHYEKNVKIKGLGTFKVIDVRDRESVNVNTGERFVIEGHGKITFTPDAVVRDLVNKPFALFKEVELNDGVDIKMMSSVSEIELKEDENTDEEVKSTENQEGEVTPTTEDEAETPLETVETETAPVSSDEDEQDTGKEEEIRPSETAEKTGDEKISESSEQEEQEEYTFDDEDEGWFSRHKGAVIAVIVILVVALLGGGYYLWHERMQGEQVAKKDVVAEVSTDTVSAKDTAAIKAEKQENAEQTVAEDLTKVKEENLPRGLRNAMAIVNTGAYRIVGTDMTITVSKGDNIRRISKRYFGDGMESYVIVHNGVVEVETGMKLKIPKLEYKKKK